MLALPAFAQFKGPDMRARNGGIGSWNRMSVAANPLTDAPMWMHFLGVANEADPMVTGSSTIQGLHYYANFTVANGGTLTLGNSTSGAASAQTMPRAALIVVSPGVCTVAGTISGNALWGTAGAGAVGNNNYGGGGGGGGGFGASAGFAGGVGQLPTQAGTAAVSGNGSGGATSGTAGGSVTMTVATGSQELVAQDLLNFGQFGGAQGGGGQANASGGALGGGGVALICNAINLTGTINVSGGNGAAGGSNIGGNGAGGGGVVILAAHSINNPGTINTSGGTGGAIGTGTSGAGGAGGPGWSAVYTLN